MALCCTATCNLPVNMVNFLQITHKIYPTTRFQKAIYGVPFKLKFWFVPFIMTTSNDSDFFWFTDPLCGKFTGHRWIPLTKTSHADLWCFIWSPYEQTVKQTIERLVIWGAIALITMSLKYFVSVVLYVVLLHILTCYNGTQLYSFCLAWESQVLILQTYWLNPLALI